MEQKEGNGESHLVQQSTAMTSPNPLQEGIPVKIKVGRFQRISGIFTILAAISTLVLVFIVAQQLATARRDLQTAKQELLALTRQQARERIDRRYTEFYSPRMLYSRGKAAEMYPEPSAHILKIFQFFETLARDHQENIVSTHDVWYQFRDPLLMYWSGWKSWVDERRNVEQDPTIWEGYESLVQSILEEKNDRLLTGPEIEELLRYEIDLLEKEKEYRREFDTSAETKDE